MHARKTQKITPHDLPALLDSPHAPAPEALAEPVARRRQLSQLLRRVAADLRR
jgi:hypothetical protein